MAVGRGVVFSAAWFLVAGPAQAAEVTDMPPELGVLGDLSYVGSRLSGGLEESGIRVSDRRFLRHDLRVRLEFAPVRGAALTLGIDATPAMSWDFPGSRTMLLDPLNGAGTYLTPADREDATSPGAPVTGTTTGATGGAPDADAAGFDAGGLNGVWIGVAVAPFSQSYQRHQAANWRLDLAFRTGSANKNLWTFDGDKRGTSPGGSALRIGGAFSSDYGVGEPYLAVLWHRENKVSVDVVDAEGNEVTSGLEVRPGSRLSSTGGVEIVAWEDLDDGNRVAFDFSGTFGYQGWQDVATGVYLPDTLELGEAIPMTTSEHVFFGAGLAVDFHGAEYLRGRVGVNATYRTPYRLEHLYPVYTTPDSWELGWTITLGGAGAVVTD
jgi:hypothetical protein